MSLLYSLDMLGTFAFAASGALAGVSKKMDIYGICFLALVTAVGGGTIRDIIVGKNPPFLFVDYNYLVVSLVAAFLVFLFHQRFKKEYTILLWMDALGLGVFNIIGISVGREHDIAFPGSILLGIMTGTFGGMIRDVLIRETPLVLTREVYASACLLGGFLFWGLDALNVANHINLAASALFVFGFRMLAITKKWQLPKPTA
jgi:uncharacterized membrane protein YeiH